MESSRGRVYIPASNHNPNMLAYPPPPKPEHFISPLTLAEVQEQQEEEERVRNCLTRTKQAVPLVSLCSTCQREKV